MEKLRTYKSKRGGVYELKQLKAPEKKKRRSSGKVKVEQDGTVTEYGKNGTLKATYGSMAEYKKFREMDREAKAKPKKAAPKAAKPKKAASKAAKPKKAAPKAAKPKKPSKAQKMAGKARAVKRARKSSSKRKPGQLNLL